MDRTPKRAKTTVPSDLEALWHSYDALVAMKEDARRKVLKIAAVQAALTHPVWDSANGACRLVDYLEKRHAGVMRRAQALTLAELCSSPPYGVADVAGEFRKALADMVAADAHIADIVAGVPMRETYPVVEDSDDAILAGYHDMDKFAHHSAALDLFADMHTGLCRDGSASIGAVLTARIEVVLHALDQDLWWGSQLCVQCWKLKSVLRRQIQTLGDAIDRCSSGLSELEHVLDLAEDSDYAVLCVLPPHQCYVCLEYHRNGLVWCSTCAAALCAGCVQDLVGSLIESGSVAAANGEAAIPMRAVRDVSLARDHNLPVYLYRIKY